MSLNLVEPQSVIIIGTGNEIVNGTDSIKVKLTVVANNYETEIIVIMFYMFI